MTHSYYSSFAQILEQLRTDGRIVGGQMYRTDKDAVLQFETRERIDGKITHDLRFGLDVIVEAPRTVLDAVENYLDGSHLGVTLDHDAWEASYGR